MEFPGHLAIGGTDYQLQQVPQGLLYTPAGLTTPYVFIPSVGPVTFNDWLVTGIFRTRLSHGHKPAEFQRGERNPYVSVDHMVKSAAPDDETASFARMFWTEIAKTQR